MKEAEFRALLAIEGLELEVEQTRFRGADWRSSGWGKLHSMALIRDKDGGIPMRSSYVTRRHYAIQSLIKRYYSEAK